MKKNDYFSIVFRDDKFIFLDQVKLPKEEVYVETDKYERIAEAIEKLEIRGAPAIGIAAAYGLALSLKPSVLNGRDTEDAFNFAYLRLAATRPTAVNLFFALDEVKKTFSESASSLKPEDLYKKLLSSAIKLHQDDIKKCTAIGINGLEIFRRKSTILTHCNTGKLATGGDGTAFNVIKTGFEKNLVNFVYADETRPLLQGSRLTAFELEKNGIPFALQSDSTAAVLMAEGKIDFVVVGADRIALNGDTANKVGTYNLAVLCIYHKIPFYIAAPSTTIDRKTAAGKDIKIEIRNKMELLAVNNIPVTPENYEAYTPAFDVTPAELITGIITEDKVYYYPYSF